MLVARVTVFPLGPSKGIASVTEVVITRGNYYGNELAYAANATGTRLGYINLGSGKVKIHVESERAAVTEALQAYALSLSEPQSSPPVKRSSTPFPTEAPTPVKTPPPATSPVHSDATTTEEVDLAGNLPGQLTRQRAAEEWERQKRIGRPLAILAKLADAKSDERAWRVGAKGEEVVGKQLNKLRKRGWYVLHSIRVGTSSDIDHC